VVAPNSPTPRCRPSPNSATPGPSLREIAQNSGFSHGVLHYYFSDKVDLITHCVKRYKAQCILRYDQIVATAGTAQALRLSEETVGAASGSESSSALARRGGRSGCRRDGRARSGRCGRRRA